MEILSPSKKVEAVENYVCAVKNIWNNMTLFVCLRWSISRFFWMILVLLTTVFIITFCKDCPDQNFPHIFDQMKHKAGNRFHPHIENNKPKIIVCNYWLCYNTLQYFSITYVWNCFDMFNLEFLSCLLFDTKLKMFSGLL